jgi:ABC-2 type transport system permease protein
MSRALQYEWVRLRTLRSTWWLLGTALAVAAGVAALFAGFASSPKGTLVLALTALAGQAVPLCGILMGLVGAFAIGHEYRYGTIRLTLPVVPRRTELLLAKVLVVAVWSVLVAAASLLLAYLVLLVWPGSVILDDPVDGDALTRILVGFVLLVLLYALVGMALAGLLRNLPGAIVLLVVWPLVVETILVGLTFIPGLDGARPATKYLPFSAGQRLLSTDAGDQVPGVTQLRPWEGGAVFAALALVLLVAWAVSFRRRDA